MWPRTIHLMQQLGDNSIQALINYNLNFFYTFCIHNESITVFHPELKQARHSLQDLYKLYKENRYIW